MTTKDKQSLILTNARNKQSLILTNARNKQRITLFVNPPLVKHARAQAIVEELSLTTLVEKALISYLPKETVLKKADIKVNFDS